MRKKLSAFLLAGILFFAGGTEGVLAAQAGSGTNFVEESVSQEAENPQNLGGLRGSQRQRVKAPRHILLPMMCIPPIFITIS